MGVSIVEIRNLIDTDLPAILAIEFRCTPETLYEFVTKRNKSDFMTAADKKPAIALLRDPNALFDRLTLSPNLLRFLEGFLTSKQRSPVFTGFKPWSVSDLRKAVARYRGRIEASRREHAVIWGALSLQPKTRTNKKNR
jgi:hypothetical protein